jgi:hypothetical protein
MNTRPELVRHRARLKGDDSMNENLKTCPSCGAKARLCSDGYGQCVNVECALAGPSNDPTGEKWNALPRREQKAESRWYYEEGTGILRQYPEGLMYSAGLPAGTKPIAPEKLCISDGDKRIPDSEARALIAKWQKPSNPTPAPEPPPADEQVLWTGEVDGKRYELTTAGYTKDQCRGCVADGTSSSVGLCGKLNDHCQCVRLGEHVGIFRLATPQPQPAPERVCVTQFHHGGLGGAFTPEDYAGYAVPEDSRRLDYTLTSIHEAKWRAAVELAAIAEAKVKTLKQERDHASDMANAATARVADLEEKLSASRKLAQLYLEGRNQEWGRAEELQRRISVIQEAVRDIPTQFSGKAVPLG